MAWQYNRRAAGNKRRLPLPFTIPTFTRIFP